MTQETTLNALKAMDSLYRSHKKMSPSDFKKILNKKWKPTLPLRSKVDQETEQLKNEILTLRCSVIGRKVQGMY